MEVIGTSGQVAIIDHPEVESVIQRTKGFHEVIDAANGGMPVLGICNGFQLLVAAHLLPGGLIRTDHGDFIRRDQRLRVESTASAWTNGFTEGQEIVIPLKNGEGGYIADEATLDRLEGEGLVAFRYLDVNPNGSLRDIAGLRNERGNVVGLMPHPEHAVEAGFGPDTQLAMRSGTDGLTFFTSVLKQSVLN